MNGHARFVSSHARFDAIICDIDGCLCAETTKPLDLTTLAKIAEHNRTAAQHRDRPLVTLCTGRPQPFAECITRLIGNTTLPVVAENGVWIYDPAGHVYQRDPAISQDQVRAVHDAAAWLHETYGRSDAHREGVQQQPGKSCSISLYHKDPAYLKSICPAIERTFAERGWPLRVSMTWTYINCDLKHVSKGTGLDRLIAACGLDTSRLAGIGDTLGDLPIRERVAWFGCPSNAADELKPRADVVSTHAEAEGVWELIERVTG